MARLTKILKIELEEHNKILRDKACDIANHEYNQTNIYSIASRYFPGWSRPGITKRTGGIVFVCIHTCFAKILNITIYEK